MCVFVVSDVNFVVSDVNFVVSGGFFLYVKFSSYFCIRNREDSGSAFRVCDRERSFCRGGGVLLLLHGVGEASCNASPFIFQTSITRMRKNPFSDKTQTPC